MRKTSAPVLKVNEDGKNKMVLAEPTIGHNKNQCFSLDILVSKIYPTSSNFLLNGPSVLMFLFQ